MKIASLCFFFEIFLALKAVQTQNGGLVSGRTHFSSMLR